MICDGTTETAHNVVGSSMAKAGNSTRLCQYAAKCMPLSKNGDRPEGVEGDTCRVVSRRRSTLFDTLCMISDNDDGFQTAIRFQSHSHECMTRHH